MVPGIALAAVLLAFALTIIEMTEVVALVFALGAERGALRPAALGAVAGVAGVSGVALVVGVGLEALPRGPLLGGAAVTLFLFGIFLYRSTRKAYRRARAPASAAPPVPSHLHFAGGAVVGSVEATEVVIVLVALAAGGNGFSALLGSVAAGILLVVIAAVIHERIRRIKVPTLKFAATSALFSFAVFWGAEAIGFQWPGPSAYWDLWLLPLFGLAAGILEGLLRLDARSPVPGGAKG
jgi:Ca2+/H+ antiporter, TMEM165/GDT1 family